METDNNELKDLIDDKIKPQYHNKPERDWPSEARKGYKSWETFFMELAILTNKRSTHPHEKVNKNILMHHNYSHLGWSMCSVTI